MQNRLLLKGHPYVRRIAAQRFAKEAGRRNADHGEWLAFNKERGSHDRGIGAISRRPRVVADHGDRRGRRAIVVAPPIPRDNVSTAAMVNTGARKNWRNA